MRESIIGFVAVFAAPDPMETKLVVIERIAPSKPHPGHEAGSSDALIGRMRSKLSSHSGHLYS
jgi:hypothetical protein